MLAVQGKALSKAIPPELDVREPELKKVLMQSANEARTCTPIADVITIFFMAAAEHNVHVNQLMKCNPAWLATKPRVIQGGGWVGRGG